MKCNALYFCSKKFNLKLKIHLTKKLSWCVTAVCHSSALKRCRKQSETERMSFVWLSKFISNGYFCHSVELGSIFRITSRNFLSFDQGMMNTKKTYYLNLKMSLDWGFKMAFNLFVVVTKKPMQYVCQVKFSLLTLKLRSVSMQNFKAISVGMLLFFRHPSNVLEFSWQQPCLVDKNKALAEYFRSQNLFCNILDYFWKSSLASSKKLQKFI